MYRRIVLVIAIPFAEIAISPIVLVLVVTAIMRWIYSGVSQEDWLDSVFEPGFRIMDKLVNWAR